jgi:hypothetical protein
MKKNKKLSLEDREVIEKHLEKFYNSLGHSVILLRQTQKALKKDTVTLRVNTVALGEDIRGLQRMQRTLLDHLKQARVPELDA